MMTWQLKWHPMPKFGDVARNNVDMGMLFRNKDSTIVLIQCLLEDVFKDIVMLQKTSLETSKSSSRYL